MAGRHAILGPSSASRWLACTPSARFEEQIPEQESEFALEGTLAHELAALILSSRAGIFRGTQELFNQYLETLQNRIIDFYVASGSLTAEAGFFQMLEYAEEWAAFIIAQEGEIFIEQEYDISAYVPLGFGTADATVITSDVLYVSDLKYGVGVAVSAVSNNQLMLYGIGALTKAIELGHKPETVVLTIFQPRAGGLSSWTISVSDLLKWAEFEVKPKALLAIAGQGEFNPGKHCQFCKARTNCSAYFRKFQNIKEIYDKRVIKDKDIAYVLQHGSTISSWIKKIEEEAIKRLQNRKKLPGFKLVAGKGQRQFKNEDDVIDILIGEGYNSNAIFDISLKGITEIEKSLGAKKFKALFASEITIKEGKPQITTIDDSRPAISASAADDYEDEDDLL